MRSLQGPSSTGRSIGWRSWRPKTGASGPRSSCTWPRSRRGGSIWTWATRPCFATPTSGSGSRAMSRSSGSGRRGARARGPRSSSTWSRGSSRSRRWSPWLRTYELLDEAVGKTTREIEELVAARYPQSMSPRGRWPARPIAEGTCELTVTVSMKLVTKLERAIALCRHRNPEGRADEVLEAGLDRLIAEVEKERFAVTEAPRAGGRAATSGPSAAARREVYERDGGACSFVGADGTRCGERAFVELDHASRGHSAAPTRPTIFGSFAGYTISARPRRPSEPRPSSGRAAGVAAIRCGARSRAR